MDKIKPNQYWKMVRDIAWERAWAGANMKVVIPALVFTIAGVSCYGLLAFAKLVPYPTFSDNATATLSIQLGQIFVPILIFAYLVLRSFAYIPPELHNQKVCEISEQGKTIKKLNGQIERLTTASTEVQPLQVKIFEDPYFVGICVTNPNLEKVTDLKIELTGDARWINANQQEDGCGISLSNRQFNVPEHLREIPRDNGQSCVHLVEMTTGESPLILFLLMDRIPFNNIYKENNTLGVPYRVATIKLVVMASGTTENKLVESLLIPLVVSFAHQLPHLGKNADGNDIMLPGAQPTLRIREIEYGQET